MKDGRESENHILKPRTMALLEQSLAIEAEEAKAAGSLGYMARVLAQVSMPYSKHEGSEFTRTNGNMSLSILSPSKVGLPYGTIPRLVLAWITTEAVKKKQQELVLGDTLSEFMRELDLVPTGGRWGTITRLREQMKRLFSSSISYSYEDKAQGIFAETGMRVASRVQLWWDANRPEQAGLWQSEVILTHEFFEEVTRNPVPVDMRALKALRQSPLALDLYAWLTYRMSYLSKPTLVPWVALRGQFGSDFARERAFKEAMLKHLPKVLTVYPKAKVEATDDGLRLKPSPSHVSKGRLLL